MQHTQQPHVHGFAVQARQILQQNYGTARASTIEWELSRYDTIIRLGQCPIVHHMASHHISEQHIPGEVLEACLYSPAPALCRADASPNELAA